MNLSFEKDVLSTCVYYGIYIKSSNELHITTSIIKNCLFL